MCAATPKGKIYNIQEWARPEAAPIGQAAEKTLAQAGEAWIIRKAGRPWVEKTEQTVRRFFAGWVAFLGDRPLSTIRPADVEALFLDRSGGQFAPSTVNLERKWMKAFWAYAKRLEIAAHDPTHAWEPLPKRPVRERRRIEKGGEGKIALHLPGPCARFLVFLVATGLRISEGYGLLWKYVVEEGGGLVLQIPAELRKQRLPLRLCLSARAVQAMGPRGKPDARIFSDLPCQEWFRKLLKRACKKAGIPEIRPHDCRRTWSVRLAEAGAPPMTHKEIMGSKTLEVIANEYYPAIPDALAREYLERSQE